MKSVIWPDFAKLPIGLVISIAGLVVGIIIMNKQNKSNWFTVIVYYGVCNAKKVFLPGAIVFHMLVDTFPALYQRGVVSLWTVEIWAALWTAVIVFIAMKLYRKIKASSETERALWDKSQFVRQMNYPPKRIFPLRRVSLWLWDCAFRKTPLFCAIWCDFLGCWHFNLYMLY